MEWLLTASCGYLAIRVIEFAIRLSIQVVKNETLYDVYLNGKKVDRDTLRMCKLVYENIGFVKYKNVVIDKKNKTFKVTAV